MQCSSCLRLCDCVSQVRFFRYEQFKTLSGTYCCVLIPMIGFFLFFNIIIGTFQKSMITSTSSRVNLYYPYKITIKASKQFSFAIIIPGMNLTAKQRVFDIAAQYKTLSQNGVNTSIPLTPCSSLITEFQSYETEVEAKNMKPLLESALCLPNGINIDLQGLRMGENFTYAKISIKPCTNNSFFPGTTCASSQSIAMFWKKNAKITVNFYFINTLINPSQQNFIDLYLQQSNYFIFNQANAVSANLYFSDYSITTDNSIWPWSSEETKAGFLVQQLAEQRLDFGPSEYFKLYLRRSPIRLQYKRSFQKIDMTLAYIGGFFGPIILFISKVISLYNTNCYLLQFSDRELPEGQQKLVDRYHFGSCFVYSCLNWLKKIGCCKQIPNQFHSKIEKAEVQINQILEPISSQEKKAIETLVHSHNSFRQLLNYFNRIRANRQRRQVSAQTILLKVNTKTIQVQTRVEKREETREERPIQQRPPGQFQRENFTNQSCLKMT